MITIIIDIVVKTNIINRRGPKSLPESVTYGRDGSGVFLFFDKQNNLLIENLLQELACLHSGSSVTRSCLFSVGVHASVVPDQTAFLRVAIIVFYFY